MPPPNKGWHEEFDFAYNYAQGHAKLNGYALTKANTKYWYKGGPYRSVFL
jgi:hypothetical protein